MINVSDIVKALHSQLKNNENVNAVTGGRVYRGEYVNMDPNQTPWLGVYRGEVSFTPRTLGSAKNWEAMPNIKVIAQVANMRSASECEDTLNDLVEKVIDAVTDDTTIDGTVDMITGYSIEYGYIETEMETLYFQSAIITFGMEVATR